jgi:hypothetical protein
MQGLKFGDRLLENIEPERDGPPSVFWLFGPTGSGKSRTAHEFIRRIREARNWSSWKSFDNSLKWFDGYSNHEVALFDDFRGSEANFATLLRICDRYSCRVPIKGASRWWAPRVIIFTSCQSLEGAFGFLDRSDAAAQFFRRVRHEGNGGEYDFGAGGLDMFRGRIDWHLSVAEIPEAQSARSEEGACESKEGEGEGESGCVSGGQVPRSLLVGSSEGALPFLGSGSPLISSLDVFDCGN